MPRKTVDLTAQIRRLEKCLEEVRYRGRAAPWARDALRILEDLDFEHAETRALVTRLCEDDGTDKNEMMARCHVMLGREAFLTAERHFWKLQPVQDSPDMSCRISVEEDYFAPAQRAMGRKANGRRAVPRKGAAGADYASAVFHFERANKLFRDPWYRQTPRNLRLAGVLKCDPCTPSFYLAMIALRQDDLTQARARFKKVWQVPPIRAAREGAMTRGQLQVAAAVFEGVAALLQGRLTEAASALKQARRLDRQNPTVVRNQGYLHEQQGEMDKAISCYREALEWDRTDRYALRRLASAEARWGHTPAPVIKLRRPSDFHVKFAEIAGALRAIHGSKTAPKPMPETILDRIRVAARRVDRKGTFSNAMKLPESVKTILRHDRNFALWPDNVPLLGAIVEMLASPSRAKQVVPSADIDRLVRNDTWTPYAKAFKKLPERVPVWNDDPNLPSCIPLHSNPKGEQLLFVYVGRADADGEYPIARYDGQPELWVAEASLIHLVIGEAIQAGVRIECAFDFEKLGKKALERNAIYNECLSDDPLVQAIVASD